ncbi:hypothetical protein Bca52824_088038 [Brassica carinata]|uniref:Uncharacterized protein n=1 Tax=Brassica carinata TaxID=52824 RepID=A0A8X7PBT8_BRACI|nr:hypothetical protein Bca52824_088038 [Brassica carinata]
MVLTLEDAYYHGQHNSPEVHCCSVTPKDMHGAHDSFDLAVANIAYHVYSLGEGCYAQVLMKIRVPRACTTKGLRPARICTTKTRIEIERVPQRGGTRRGGTIQLPQE